MQTTADCDPTPLLKSTHLEAKFDDNLQEKVKSVYVTLCLHVKRVMIAS